MYGNKPIDKRVLAIKEEAKSSSSSSATKMQAVGIFRVKHTPEYYLKTTDLLAATGVPIIPLSDWVEGKSQICCIQ